MLRFSGSILVLFLVSSCSTVDLQYALFVPRLQKEISLVNCVSNDGNLLFQLNKEAYLLERNEQTAIKISGNLSADSYGVSSDLGELFATAYNRQKDASYCYSLGVSPSSGARLIVSVQGQIWQASLVSLRNKVYFTRFAEVDATGSEGTGQYLYVYDLLKKVESRLSLPRIRQATNFVVGADDERVYFNMRAMNKEESGLYYIETKDDSVAKLVDNIVTAFIEYDPNHLLCFERIWVPGDTQGWEGNLFFLDTLSKKSQYVLRDVVYNNRKVDLVGPLSLYPDKSKVVFASEHYLGQYNLVSTVMEVDIDGRNLHEVPINSKMFRP